MKTEPLFSNLVLDLFVLTKEYVMARISFLVMANNFLPTPSLPKYIDK